nr:MAG TPA: hypothetical protein [Caudoviricetes sp.]
MPLFLLIINLSFRKGLGIRPKPASIDRHVRGMPNPYIFIPSLYFCKGSHFPLKMQ